MMRIVKYNGVDWYVHYVFPNGTGGVVMALERVSDGQLVSAYWSDCKMVDNLSRTVI